MQVWWPCASTPAGCTNLCRVSQTTRGAPLRTERLGVEIPHAAPIQCPAPAAHVVQRRGGALKTRKVPVQIRSWASPRVAQCRGVPLKTGRLQVQVLPRGPFSGMPTGQANRASVLTSACLRASGASPRHSANSACSSKRTVRLINGIALDECRDRERYPARRPFYPSKHASLERSRSTGPSR